jgi:hypothetical protein
VRAGEASALHLVGRPPSIGRLEARLARSAGDWSIALPDGCRIHQWIDASELPVHHETRRSGRPYTLILSKMGELFEGEARERRSWQSELARLGRLGAG